MKKNLKITAKHNEYKIEILVKITDKNGTRYSMKLWHEALSNHLHEALIKDGFASTGIKFK